jgi:hypothetical protein
MLPFSEAVYDFKTDLKEDSFTSVTADNVTTDNFTLTHEVYDDDTSTLTILSSLSDDIPVLSSYAPVGHSVLISGLADNTTRTLQIAYDIYALSGWAGIDTLVSRLNLIWLLCLVAFIPVALVAIWRGRA